MEKTIFKRKTPLEREWDALRKQEKRYLERRREKKDPLLNRKLSEAVPEKLQDTLTAAFSKAFELVFEKGTPLIEKTYDRGRMEKEFAVNRYADEVYQNRRSLRAFRKKAEGTGAGNVLLSAASGGGMGILGIGLPDIPLFIGLVLKSVYQTALSYGYDYEKKEERYLILLLIQGAVSYGRESEEADRRVEAFFAGTELPGEDFQKEEIQKASALLAKELLYMKFLQGIPVVGLVGGLYDAVYMKRITEYADLKYRKRFLMERKRI